MKKRLPKDKGAPQFDFLAGKGPMAVLVDQYGVQVRCTEWPASLLSMLAHGVLRGAALEYAEKLNERSTHTENAAHPSRL